jgi:hypothetical protein
MNPATDRIPVTVREWTDILARIRFGTVAAAGKNYSAARIKLVAHRLATYADSDGSRVRPGIARLALDLEIDYRTARDTLALLRRLGLIHLSRGSTRRGHADEYRLTLPLDLLDRDDLDVWTPTRHATELQRLREIHRGASRTRDRHPDRHPPRPAAPAPTVDPDPPAQGPQAPAPQNSAGAPRPGRTGCAGACRATAQGPAAPATDQDLDTTTTAQPPQQIRTAVTLARGTPPAPQQAPAAATREITPAPGRPHRCEHGLTTAVRDDGRPACALCRITQDRPTVGRPGPRPRDQTATGT